jgi:hypothetical protein
MLKGMLAPAEKSYNAIENVKMGRYDTKGIKR